MQEVQAEEALMLVGSDEYKRSFVYISWLARVLLMNGKPDAAWRLYINMDSKRTSDSFSLLHLLANECFGMGQFYHSCKAFQVCASVLQFCCVCCTTENVVLTGQGQPTTTQAMHRATAGKPCCSHT
jgi:hypothetical protein